MSTSALDALIHNPQRLRIVATLAALRDGDTLSVSRLHTMIGLPPGSPIIGLRELGHAGYVRTETAGRTGQITVALTGRGRAALDRYTATLPLLPQGAVQPPAPGMRAGHADRDAAASALAEHFAQGRLTLDELSARLDTVLAATTFSDLSRAAQDLPDLGGLMSASSAAAAARSTSATRPAGAGPAGQRGQWPTAALPMGEHPRERRGKAG